MEDLLNDLLNADNISEVLAGIDPNTLLDLQRRLYWDVKDLPKVLELTEFALSRIKGKSQSPFLYNLASFTCPWWSDSLEIREDLGQSGLEAAKELLQLRQSGEFEPIKVAGAHWILGCHYLYTARNYDGAVEHFTRAAQMARVVDHEHAYLIEGNSIEGIGRAKVLLRKEDGSKEFKRAREIYSSAKDDYSISELDAFLQHRLNAL